MTVSHLSPGWQEGPSESPQEWEEVCSDAWPSLGGNHLTSSSSSLARVPQQNHQRTPGLHEVLAICKERPGGVFEEVRENDISGKVGTWPMQHPGLMAGLRLWRADGRKRAGGGVALGTVVGVGRHRPPSVICTLSSTS